MQHDRVWWVQKLAATINRYWYSRAWPSLLDDVLCYTGGKYAADINSREREAVRIISPCDGDTVAALPPFTDVVEGGCMALVSLGHHLSMALFFAPPHVARFMARMNYGLLPQSGSFLVMDQRVAA